jgi:hypothetical protein
VLYLATASGPKVREAMTAGLMGSIHTANGGSPPLPGVPWCADNGCFSERFDEEKWWAWLTCQDPADCLFAVAPDVVGDAAATLERSRPWLDRIAAIGFRVAFVLQDGQESLPVPWDDFDVAFIGGTTDWKLGPHARALVAEAKSRGKWVHMGRVNSELRYQYARHIGCDSADGTYLAFGPDVNLPKLLTWGSQGDLFVEAS